MVVFELFKSWHFSSENILDLTEAVTRRCSIIKVVIKISQNSKENTPQACNFIKKKLWHRRFSVNFAKFQEHLFHRTPPETASELIYLQQWDQEDNHSFNNFVYVLDKNLLPAVSYTTISDILQLGDPRQGAFLTFHI